MATNTKLDSLVINYLTQSQYDNAKNAGTLNLEHTWNNNVPNPAPNKVTETVRPVVSGSPHA